MICFATGKLITIKYRRDYKLITSVIKLSTSWWMSDTEIWETIKDGQTNWVEEIDLKLLIVTCKSVMHYAVNENVTSKLPGFIKSFFIAVEARLGLRFEENKFSYFC